MTDISFREATFAHLALMHLDDCLHFLLPFDHGLHFSPDFFNVIFPPFVIHHQLLAIHNLCLLLSVLNFQPQFLTVILDPIYLRPVPLDGAVQPINCGFQTFPHLLHEHKFLSSMGQYLHHGGRLLFELV